MRVLIATLCAAIFCAPLQTRAADVVTVDAANPMQTIRSRDALGSTVDKEPAGMISYLYSSSNVRRMLESGYGWLSYRLFTELSVQDWHWNAAGHFSAIDGGYWTSDASTVRSDITDSYGYRLPHSGFTSDQGNNEGYSRITDGDRNTYWKSNPYLASGFTGDNDSQHPQWVVVDAGRAQTIDAIHISFVHPYAQDFRIEYWTGSDPINDPVHGSWRAFGNGIVRNATLNSASAARKIHASMPVRFVRILLQRSSNTCDTHGDGDSRNCVGYAIAEVALGRFDGSGNLRDVLVHRRCGGATPGRGPCGVRQSATYVSSVDPWHDATSRVTNQAQPGLDLIARSGLTRGLPALYPVPMLYSTPGNAVNEIRYLRARGYNIGGIELGEEPDGQYAMPEDYGALYVQWARAIHGIDPSLKLGGPVFSGVNDDLPVWSDASGNHSWLSRFLTYLRAHGAMRELSFMSFEHYPFGGCEHGDALTRDLLDEPAIVARVVHAWRNDGLPEDVPMYITEANFSAVNFSETPMTIEGALWQADYMASALENGVQKVVYYQYEPVPLSQNTACPDDWGNLTMFVADKRARIHARAAQFWAARMVMNRWFSPGNSVATLYRAGSTAMLMHRQAVTAYALQGLDRTWSIMLVNKDTKPRTVTVRFLNGERAAALSGPVESVTFGPDQYVWHREGALSIPAPDDPPKVTWLRASRHTQYVLQGRSITVLRGAAAPNYSR